MPSAPRRPSPRRCTLAIDNTEVNYYRTDYGSQLRDGAAMLALAAETKPMPAAVPAMIRFVAAARAKASYTSTQDEAWMLLAARAIKEGNQAIQLNDQRLAACRSVSRPASPATSC